MKKRKLEMGRNDRSIKSPLLSSVAATSAINMSTATARSEFEYGYQVIPVTNAGVNQPDAWIIGVNRDASVVAMMCCCPKCPRERTLSVASIPGTDTYFCSGSSGATAGINGIFPWALDGTAKAFTRAVGCMHHGISIDDVMRHFDVDVAKRVDARNGVLRVLRHYSPGVLPAGLGSEKTILPFGWSGYEWSGKDVQAAEALRMLTPSRTTTAKSRLSRVTR